MRRSVGPIMLVALVLGLLGILATPAQAAPASACTGSAGYPQNVNATVQVSSTNPVVGSRIEVSGVAYCGNEDIVITLDGTRVATSHTDASGAFDPPIRITGPTGDRQVCAAGETDIPTNRDCLTINVRAAAAENVTPAESGGTAFTGVRIGLLVALAAVLLVGGLLLARFGRRRRELV